MFQRCISSLRRIAYHEYTFYDFQLDIRIMPEMVTYTSPFVYSVE